MEFSVGGLDPGSLERVFRERHEIQLWLWSGLPPSETWSKLGATVGLSLGGGGRGWCVWRHQHQGIYQPREAARIKKF